MLFRSDQVASVVRSVPGADEVQIEQTVGQGYLNVRLDRAAMARFGIPMAEVQEALWSEAATFWAADDLLRALQAAPAALVSASSTAAAALLVALEADAPVQQRSADAAAALRHEDAFAQALGLATPDLAAAAQRGLLASAAWLLP